MKRWFTIIFAVIALALLIGALTNSTRRPRAMFGPTYTPSQVTIGGTGWQVLVGGKLYRLQLGQHFYLRGAIWSISPSHPAVTGVFDSMSMNKAMGSRNTGIVVAIGPSDPLHAMLRRVPLVGSILPLPPTADHPLIGHVATYRVALVPCGDLCAPGLSIIQLQDGGNP